VTGNNARTFHGIAIDAGSGLEATLRSARGTNASADDLAVFKRCVLQVLGTGASTALVDAQLGAELLSYYPDGCARMLAYEADVYHISDEDRITVLPAHLKPSDYAGLGVDQLKFFIYYAPDDDPELNSRKRQLVADIGQQCRDLNLRFLMEPLVYHPTIESGTAAYARIKPELVKRATEIFSEPQFYADVLKVEVPVDLNFVEGFGEANNNLDQISREEALNAFRDAAAPANQHDLVYLSAGVPFEWFEASLQLASEAGVNFSGFMCGRALWSDAVEVFGTGGEDELKQWLTEVGVTRLQRLIKALD